MINLNMKYIELFQVTLYHFSRGKKCEHIILVLTFLGYSQFGSYILIIVNLVIVIF